MHQIFLQQIILIHVSFLNSLISISTTKSASGKVKSYSIPSENLAIKPF